MGSWIMFTLVAIGAHVLVWLWRPWFPGVGGY
jgi:light-harvesting complex 1 beta chain